MDANINSSTIKSNGIEKKLNKAKNRIKNRLKNKIMILKVGAIGDVLMSTPFVRQLRRMYPNSKIDYWVGKGASVALEGNPYIDNIISFDEQIFFKKKFYKFLKLINQVKKRDYDVIFILDKHIIFSLFAKFSGVKKRIGFDRLGKEGLFLSNNVYYGNEKHEIHYYLDLLNSFKSKKNSKIDVKDSKIDLFLSNTSLSYADKEWKKLGSKLGLNTKKVIGIAPGGGRNTGEKTEIRNMPIEKYVELIKVLTKDEKNVVILFGNKDDKEKEDIIMKNVQSKNIFSYIGKCSLMQTAALMSKSDFIICNDTGSMHIAAAVNKRIISIFGPTNPLRKAPLCKESKFIWKDQQIYDSNYELYGAKSRNKKFFETINVNEILKLINKLK